MPAWQRPDINLHYPTRYVQHARTAPPPAAPIGRRGAVRQEAIPYRRAEEIAAVFFSPSLAMDISAAVSEWLSANNASRAIRSEPSGRVDSEQTDGEMRAPCVSFSSLMLPLTRRGRAGAAMFARRAGWPGLALPALANRTECSAERA